MKVLAILRLKESLRRLPTTMATEYGMSVPFKRSDADMIALHDKRGQPSTRNYIEQQDAGRVEAAGPPRKRPARCVVARRDVTKVPRLASQRREGRSAHSHQMEASHELVDVSADRVTGGR